MQKKMILQLLINSLCLLLLVFLIWQRSSLLLLSIALTSIIITNSIFILKSLFSKKF